MRWRHRLPSRRGPAGIWAVALETLGIYFPLVAVQHPYVFTEPQPLLSAIAGKAARPLVRDVDNSLYLREHGDRLGFGWYNHPVLTADPSVMTRADLPFPDRGFSEYVDWELFPFLENASFSRRLNGLFSMTPDGDPMVGQIAGWDGLWVAEAVYVTHAGGVGKMVADQLLGRASAFDDAKLQLGRFHERDREAERRRSLALYNQYYDWLAVEEA